MAGHSKWANIKFRKSLQDAKRGKVFTKLIREISVAARLGGPDESSNSRLRDAVTKALKANMKRDTIDNAIKRGAGSSDCANMVEMQYEGYGPGGTAILVLCLSDNKNRTVSEVRHAFTKHNGSLGTDGSVSYLFDKRGEIFVDKILEDKVLESIIENGAIDIVTEDSQTIILTEHDNYHNMLTILKDLQVEIEHSQINMAAKTLVPMTHDAMSSLEGLIDMLEDLDDVQEVFHNAVLETEG